MRNDITTEPGQVVYMPPALVQEAPITPLDMLNRAVSQGASIEILTKLMDLQDRWDRSQARRAFDEAVAAAKAEIPVIAKNRTGRDDKRYADFAAYASAIDPVIAKHGLSYRFRTTQDDRIHVTCIISHKAGHSEENTLSGPPDNSGGKNAIQSIGSTLSYLQRYSLVQALGLAAAEDDDGHASGNGGQFISEDELATIQSLIVETGSDIEKFCRYLKVETLPEIPAAKYKAAIVALESKRTKR